MKRSQIEEYIKEAFEIKSRAIKNELNDDFIIEYKSHFDNFPKRLYKYAKVKDYYLDSIKNKYIYLCPANELDDQFECRFNFAKELIKDNPNKYLNRLIYSLVDIIDDYPNSLGKENIKKIIRNITDDNNEIDYDKLKNELVNSNRSVSEEDADCYINVFENMINILRDSFANDFLKELTTKSYFAHEISGIGSLTENNKSQVMWQMYGDGYKGICIEYEFYDDYNAMLNIFPVVYRKKYKKDFILILTGIVLGAIIENISCGKFSNIENLKNYIYIFITKYKEWSFQKEWRAIGEAEDKLYVKKIKSIYLGKKINDTNKNNVIKIAKEKGINVYQQVDDMDSLSIKYEKIKL